MTIDDPTKTEGKPAQSSFEVAGVTWKDVHDGWKEEKGKERIGGNGEKNTEEERKKTSNAPATTTMADDERLGPTATVGVTHDSAPRFSSF